MEPLWDRVKKSMAEWYGVAYDKTDELARIGKKKIEMAGINRTIEKHLSELGGRLFDLITEKNHKGNKTVEDEIIKRFVEEIRELEQQLKLKEDEIETIKMDGGTGHNREKGEEK